MLCALAGDGGSYSCSIASTTDTSISPPSPPDEPAAALPAAAAPATTGPAAAAPAAAVSQSVSMSAAVPDYFESRAWRVGGHIGQDEHAWTSANGRRQPGGMRGARHQPGGMLAAPNACALQVAKHGR